MWNMNYEKVHRKKERREQIRSGKIYDGHAMPIGFILLLWTKSESTGLRNVHIEKGSAQKRCYRNLYTFFAMTHTLIGF